jgi:ribosomal protein S18 acetylase RimI-like enzyme
VKVPIRKLSGANMDIDLTTPKAQIEWNQGQCPWNLADSTNQHKCADKNVSICKYFKGVEYLNTIICNYPNNSFFANRDSTFTISGPSLGKADLCKPVLRKLPDWFGIEETNRHFLRTIDQLPTFLAQDGDRLVGFLSIKQHYSKAAEVYIMGVLPEYHRCGIGQRLLSCTEIYLQKHEVMYLQVKTLSESNPDPNYAKTRAFYLAMGFSPLEEFETLWDDANPALLLIKTL